MNPDGLSEALKALEITQEGGRGVLDENPVNPLQGEEGAIAGTSPDQRVQGRKNSKSGKRVKKRKSKGMVHSLRASGEENEQIGSENDSITWKLQLMQGGMEMQKAEFCVSQNKTIAAQEKLVETLYQKLQLMVGSDHLDVAPSKANRSLDDMTELKHRSMLNTIKIDILCEMFLEGKPEQQA